MIRTDKGHALSDQDYARLVARAQTDLIYAVLTTGILCRAGCPARTPLHKNIRRFDSVEMAIDAGFRPCKRCRPKVATPES